MDKEELLKKICNHKEMLFKINNKVFLMGHMLLYECDDDESNIYKKYIDIINLFEDTFNKYEDSYDPRIEYDEIIRIDNSLQELIHKRINEVNLDKLADFINELNDDEIIEVKNQIEKYNNIWWEILNRQRIKKIKEQSN